MTEKEFHNKVVWMTFVLGVLVVMIHAYNIDLFIPPDTGGDFADTVRWFEELISAAMPTVAVPGFFMVSAYLFFRDASWQNISGKMSRRVGSVLVPYIAWNTFYYVGFAVAGSFPALWDMLGRESVEFSLSGLADAILNYTYNPVLWYLKQLIILVAIAPLIYVLMSGFWLGAVVMLAVLAIVSSGYILPILNLDAFLYYSLGAFLALHGRGLVEFGYRHESGLRGEGRNRSGLLRCVLLLAGAAASISFYTASGRYGSILMIVLFAIVTPATIWLALPSALPEAKSYMKFSLFLYCFHFLPVRALNKAGAIILPHNAATAIIVYMLLPVIVVLMTWGLAVLLKKKMPLIWKLMSGGR